MLWGSPVIQSACGLQPCFRRIGVACVCIIQLGQHRGHSLSGDCSRREFVCLAFVSLEHLGQGTQHVPILWCGCSSHYQQVEIQRVCPWLVSGRKTHDLQPCPFKLCSGVLDVCCCAAWASGCSNSMAVCVHKVAFILLGRHGWQARHASAPTKLGKWLCDQLMFVCLAWSSV